MKFDRFSEIVKEKRQDIYKVFKHHGLGGLEGNSVGVQFKQGGKVYQYNGTYFQVLKSLKINVVQKSVIDDIYKYIDYLKKGDFNDSIYYFLYTPETIKEDLEDCYKKLKMYKSDYIII